MPSLGFFILLIAAWGVIIVLLKIILQVLMVIAGIFALSVLAQRTYYKGSDGHVYAESGYLKTFIG